jgi:predicted CopG family antitoxin
MAKQIAISDEVYGLLLGMKGDDKSFSDVIKEVVKKRGGGIMKYAGSLKKYDRELRSMEKLIQEDRNKNYGRGFDR